MWLIKLQLRDICPQVVSKLGPGSRSAVIFTFSSDFQNRFWVLIKRSTKFCCSLPIYFSKKKLINKKTAFDEASFKKTVLRHGVQPNHSPKENPRNVASQLEKSDFAVRSAFKSFPDKIGFEAWKTFRWGITFFCRPHRKNSFILKIFEARGVLIRPCRTAKRCVLNIFKTHGRMIDFH